MQSEWPKESLEALADLIIDCPHSTPEWTSEGELVLRSQNIRNGRLDLTSPSYTNTEGYLSRIKRATPMTDDLILTREAPMGEVCIIPPGLRCCMGQRMVLLRTKKQKLFPKYLLYLIQSPFLQHQIGWNEGTGTTVSNIRIPSIKAFEIPLPPLPVQKAIAHILGTLDDKIELNRRMNETLEGMAQALFKSWFVDFDPVIDNILAKNLAKCPSPSLSHGESDAVAGDEGSSSSPSGRGQGEGSIYNGIPEEFTARACLRATHRQAETRRKAMNSDSGFKSQVSNFHSLFPATFQETEEMGWIPEGWGVKKAEAIVDRKKVNQKFTKKNVLISGDIPVFDQGSGLLLGFHNGSADIAASQTSPMFIFGDHTCITHLSIKPFSVGPNVIPLGAKGYNPYWTYFAIKDLQKFQEYRRHWMEFKVKDVVVPSEDLSNLFGDVVDNMYVSIESNVDESATLTKLRDTLLPKLISGELRIEDAENMTKAGA